MLKTNFKIIYKASGQASTGYCSRHKKKRKFQLSLESTMAATRLICTNLNQINNQEKPNVTEVA